jgi:hypothetical protein
VTEKNNSKSRIFAVARAFAVVVGALIMFSAPGVANAADAENSIIVSVQDQANNNGVSEKNPIRRVSQLAKELPTMPDWQLFQYQQRMIT